jgi:hypothetical protein
MKTKRLQSDTIAKDIAVSKLSQLQKRILVYARRAMLAKRQAITKNTDATINFPAPPWLAKALTEGMTAIFKARKYFGLGENRMYDLHPRIRSLNK